MMYGLEVAFFAGLLGWCAIGLAFLAVARFVAHGIQHVPDDDEES